VVATGSSRRWLPRWTLRLRLTLLYGALFLAAGAVLLAITYELVVHTQGVETNRTLVLKEGGKRVVQTVDHGVSPRDLPKPPPQFRSVAKSLERQALSQIDRDRKAQRDALLTRSGIALGIMALLSIGLGWLMAGRALRPLRTMSVRARGISERNLHERLALDGPDDELKELGDTFDGLLGRLETAFESQRRFVANASHELRTPITLERTLVEVALADAHPSVESLKDTCRRVLAAGEQQERLIEALLTLARSQRGLEKREQLDLGAVAAEVLQGFDRDGIRVDPELSDAPTTGDPRLVERLVSNLIDNGLKYNQQRGWVRARTGMRDGRPVIEVENSGPVVAADQAAQLTEPFRRLNGHESGSGVRGLGLGLSIVAAIAEAHDASFAAVPRADGGLRVHVSFPPA
jgi:signal transduction histidine kinase